VISDLVWSTVYDVTALKVFRACDSDCDNVLDFREFQAVLASPTVRLDLEPDEQRKVFNEADPGGMGQLSFAVRRSSLSSNQPPLATERPGCS
jgi:hypothetical protein